ncbi:MAG TPA: DUF4252 domain-containing protein [Thermoanaerobaculia bacterium]|nr:DUF4252 domain-containing protein [Thermoanaerobaculia bacterium]
MNRRPRSAAAAARATVLGLALAAAALVPPPALAQRGRSSEAPPAPTLQGVPGFVDFADLGIEEPGELTLRVALHGPLLRMVAEATRGEEPGFAELIDKLQGIFARIYQVPEGRREALRSQVRHTTSLLERGGWQTVVEVHEPGGDTSYLQVRTSGERILGLAVVFMEPGGSTGFINVVGDITPEEVGRIGRTFDIEALERFDGTGGKKETP